MIRGRDRSIRRFVDGEMTAEERERFAGEMAASRELSDAVTVHARLRRALGELPREVGGPASEPVIDVADRVMREVMAAPRHRRRRWRRPLAAVALAGALAAALLLVLRAPPAPEPTALASSPDPAGTVRLALHAPRAARVEVAGEWSGWRPQPLARDPGGAWTITLSLSPGEWRYQFVVDGAWVDDPLAEGYRPDSFGGRNAIVRL